MTHPQPSDPQHEGTGSDLTRLLQRLTMPLFKVGLLVFLLAGALLVLVQVVGIVTGNEGLTVDTIPGLQSVMTYAAGLTGLLGFAMSYVFGWSGGGE